MTQYTNYNLRTSWEFMHKVQDLQVPASVQVTLPSSGTRWEFTLCVGTTSSILLAFCLSPVVLRYTPNPMSYPWVENCHLFKKLTISCEIEKLSGFQLLFIFYTANIPVNLLLWHFFLMPGKNNNLRYRYLRWEHDNTGCMDLKIVLQFFVMYLVFGLSLGWTWKAITFSLSL